MNRHPGGNAHTLRMTELAGLEKGTRILDLGAGGGETVRYLRSLGYDALGIDIAPRSEGIIRADLLCTGFEDACFDAVISQCAFYLSGDVDGAFKESFRLLKDGGVLMFSDVCFSPPEEAAEKAGFAVEYSEDMTAAWREYYIEAIWNGTAECCAVRGKCRYKLLICGKNRY